MKKTIIYIVGLFISLFTFYSCEDPYADQLVVSPTVYTNEPIQDANFVVEATTNHLTITENEMGQTASLIKLTSIPALLDTTSVIKYQILLSDNTEFTNSKPLTTALQGKTLYVDYTQLNDTLNALNNSTDEHLVYARVLAYIVNGGTRALYTTKNISFNVTTMPLVKPYYESILNTWYIVGLGGGWNNSVDGLGSDLIPLNVVSGNEYYKDGSGKYAYTGYFTASTSFKLIHMPGDWNTQWGNSGSEGIDNPVMNDGGSKNFKVPTDGYYTITLNSIKNTLTIEPATVTPATYAKMGLIGGFNSWGSDVEMSVNTNTQGHLWYATITFEAETQYKIRANSDWGINWGSASSNDGDPLYQFAGIGVSGGKNIYGNVGTFVIMFNDISGCYYLVKK